MTNEEFKEIAKEAISDMMQFQTEDIWDRIFDTDEWLNLSDEEKDYFHMGGDGDAIIDNLCKKMLDTLWKA